MASGSLPTNDSGWPVSGVITNSTATSISVSTPVTLGVNRLLVVVVNADGLNSSGVPVVSGLGLTWTKQVENTISTTTVSQIWTARASAQLSTGSVTATISGQTQAKFIQLIVHALTGVKSASTTAGAGSGSGALGGTGFNHQAKYLTNVTGGGPLPNWSNALMADASRGDGVTDATSYLKQLATTAQTNNQPVLVPFTPNGFKISATVPIFTSWGGQLGPQGQLPMIFTTASLSGFTNQGGVLAAQNGFNGWIYQLKMVGTYNPKSTVLQATEDAACVDVYGCTGLTIQNCYISSPMGDCIVNRTGGWGGTQANNVIIRNNTLYEPYRCCIAYVWHAHNWNIFDNVMSKNNSIAADNNAAYVSAIDYEPEVDSTNGGATVTNIEVGYNQFIMNNINSNPNRGADGMATFASSVSGNTNPGGSIWEHHNYGSFGVGFFGEWDGGSAFTNINTNLQNVAGNSIPTPP